MSETKGTVELGSKEAVLLVRSLLSLLDNVDAARNSMVLSIDQGFEQRDEILALVSKVKASWELDWSKQGYALGR